MIQNGWWTMWDSVKQLFTLAFTCSALCSGQSCVPRLLGNLIPLTPEGHLGAHGKVNSEPLTNCLFKLWGLHHCIKTSFTLTSHSVLTSVYPILTVPVLFLKYIPSYLSHLLKIFFISCLRGGRKSKLLHLIRKDPTWHDSSFLPTSCHSPSLHP